MPERSIDNLGAAVVFTAALILYLATVSPTVSFWDPGERIAVSHGLQIPHPPGAPFYMLVGRFFSMFAPATYVALAVNMISVLSSAVTVLLAYWIIHMLAKAWKGTPDTWSRDDHLVVVIGAAVGALTLAVSDSFWFNALEAETYAFSTMFTALCVFLALKWREHARLVDAQLPAGRHHAFGSGAERWLLLIAYLYGLAIGVHLLSLLSLFFLALIVFFEYFERPEWSRGQIFRGLVLTGLAASVAFLLLYPGIIQMLPQAARASGSPAFFLAGVVAAVALGVYYTHRKSMQPANLALLCIVLVLIGYSSYILILTRSAADPPIDQNDPENVDAFISYMLREQYGETPLLKGPTYDDRTGQIGKKEVFFPRRFSPVPQHVQFYARFNSDLDFFLRYQIGEMYVRYLMWNFSGRASDEQGAPAITGFRLIDGPDEYLRRTPSEEASRNRYFALPLLLGIFGAIVHFRRDWRRALALAVLFFMTSIGIILYLNQTPFQPRERDYSYAGSFFAFSLWVGMGATGILQLTLEALRRRGRDSATLRSSTLAGAGALLLLAVPIWMGLQNFDNRNQSGNYLPRDYAYNLLMSVDENAVLFTNGDNDTFPLWYLQEVEGVRRDVRVANLSLLNTPWYVRQLKNQWSRDSAPLPISLSDALIDQLTVVAWEPRDIGVPAAASDIPADLRERLLQEGAEAPTGQMTWRLEGRPYSEHLNILHAADQVALDIVQTNATRGWTRPIYFAVTVSPDGQLDLQDYLQLEGMAFRIVPARWERDEERVAPDIMRERLGTYRFTGVDDPRVYYDENARRMLDQYRTIYARAAEAHAVRGDLETARALLDTIAVKVPFRTIPAGEATIIYMARAYRSAGAVDAAADVLAKGESLVIHRLRHAVTRPGSERAMQFAQMLLFAYIDAGRLDEASEFSRRLADATNNLDLFLTPEELRREYARPVEEET